MHVLGYKVQSTLPKLVAFRTFDVLSFRQITSTGKDLAEMNALYGWLSYQ